jgi:hypothetical protein
LLRGTARPHPMLERTLMRPQLVPDDDPYELKSRVERLERTIEAIERMPPVDPAAMRVATRHTRLFCDPSGYAIDEIDEPPPDAGMRVEREGRWYTVWRLSPSPFPDDARRCAVLVPA